MGVVLFVGMPWILCTNITGCWFWAHRICGLLNLSAQNLRVAKFERYESAGCQNWALKYNGLLNLSAQNSAVAQIWALKYNGLLNLCIKLLIMRLNIPQTIRMSEHRQRCHEHTGLLNLNAQNLAQIWVLNPFRMSVPKISRYKSYNFSQTKVCIGSWNIDIEKSGVSTLFYWVLGVYVKRLLTESIENLHLIFFSNH